MQLNTINSPEALLLYCTLILVMLCFGLLIWLVFINKDGKILLDILEKINTTHSFPQESDIDSNKNKLNVLQQPRNTEDLSLVSSLLNELKDSSIHSITQANKLMTELNDVEPADFTNWKRSRLKPIINLKNSKTSDPETPINDLNQAIAMISALQSRLKSNENTKETSAQSDILREQLTKSLQNHKLSRAELETETIALRRSEANLQQALKIEQEQLYSLQVLSQQNEQLFLNQIKDVTDKYESIKTLYDRTLVEKEFIEMAYIRTDESK